MLGCGFVDFLLGIHSKARIDGLSFPQKRESSCLRLAPRLHVGVEGLTLISMRGTQTDDHLE